MHAQTRPASSKSNDENGGTITMNNNTLSSRRGGDDTRSGTKGGEGGLKSAVGKADTMPSREDVAAAIAAVRSRGQQRGKKATAPSSNSNSKTQIDSPSTAVSPVGTGNTTSSLFQQSAGKLGYSFSSDFSDSTGASSIPYNYNYSGVGGAAAAATSPTYGARNQLYDRSNSSGTSDSTSKPLTSTSVAARLNNARLNAIHKFSYSSTPNAATATAGGLAAIASGKVALASPAGGIKKNGPSPSMAQLRARTLMNEAQNKKGGYPKAAAGVGNGASLKIKSPTNNHHHHPHLPTSPISSSMMSPTSGGYDSDNSTDISSTINVDPDTVAQVSYFIDSLRNKGKGASTPLVRAAAGTSSRNMRPSNGALPPISPNSNYAATATNAAVASGPYGHSQQGMVPQKQYPSLANARNVMAPSPIGSNKTEKKPDLRVNTATATASTTSTSTIASSNNVSPASTRAAASNTQPMTTMTLQTTNNVMDNGQTPRIGNVTLSNNVSTTPSVVMSSTAVKETVSPTSTKSQKRAPQSPSPSSKTAKPNKNPPASPNHTTPVEVGIAKQSLQSAASSNKGVDNKGGTINTNKYGMAFSFSEELYSYDISLSDDSTFDSSASGVPDSARMGIDAFIDSLKSKNQNTPRSRVAVDTQLEKINIGINGDDNTTIVGDEDVDGNKNNATVDGVNVETEEELDMFIRSMSLVEEARSPMTSPRDRIDMSRKKLKEELEGLDTMTSAETGEDDACGLGGLGKQPEIDPSQLPSFIEDEILLALTLSAEIEGNAEVNEAAKQPYYPSPRSSGASNEDSNGDHIACHEKSIAFIKAQIRKAVRLNDPSVQLGSILADASKRGLSLNVVTEMYKKERFEAVSDQQLIESETGPNVDPKCASSPNAKLPGHKGVKSPISVKAENDTRGIISPKSLSSPQVKSPDHSGVVKSSISGEVENDMKELSLLCDRATALFDNSTGEVVSPRSTTSKSSHLPDKEVPSNSPLPSPAKISRELSEQDIADSLVQSSSSIIKTSTPKPPESCTDDCEDDMKTEEDLVVQFENKLKAAARSENPSLKLGKILAGAKKKGLAINHLVEVYKNERLSLTVPVATLKQPTQPENEAQVEAVKHEKNSTNDVHDDDQDGEPEHDEREDDATEVDAESEVEDDEEDFGVPGLSNTQLRQLKHFVNKAEEIMDEETSPHDCFDDAIKYSLGNTNIDVTLPLPSGMAKEKNLKKKASEKEVHPEITKADSVEEIDAFFNRFSIKIDEESNPKPDLTLHTQLMEEPEVEKNYSELTGDEHFIDDDESEEDEDECLDRRQVAEMHTLESGDAEVFFMKEAGLEVSFVQATEKEKRKLRKKAKREKQRIKLSAKGISTDLSKKENLPGHLGLWRSPWERNRMSRMSAGRRCDKSNPGEINGVSAAAMFVRRSGRSNRRSCHLPIKERTKCHAGYLDIDFYSLYEASEVKVEDQDIDRAPWEYRDVRQRFFDEKSLESRNWFGTFEVKRENKGIPFPVCRPKSLQLSVMNIPDPDEWNEDWYTTWKSRKDNPNNLVTFVETEMSNSNVDDASSDNYTTSSGKKRVVVEIGTLCPVRVKPGERLSKVHFDYVSSLRRSRWRKKYLKGIFPTG